MGLSLEVKAIAILALLLGLIVGVKTFFAQHDRKVVAEVKVQYDKAAAAELKRATEAQAEISNESQRMVARARADRDLVPAALSGLQHRAALGSGIRPPVAASGTAAPDAAGMYAELLGRVGKLAELYAGIADERGIAGQACVRSYNALRGAQ